MTNRTQTVLTAAVLATLAPSAVTRAGMSFNVDQGSFNGDTNRYNAAVYAMTQVVNRYNVYGDFASPNIYVYYNSGIPTAQSDYFGSIGFGGTYPNERVAQHESNHYLGSGTYGNWYNLFTNGVWTGPRMNQLIQQFDGDGSVIRQSGVHFYGYGLNYDSEVTDDSILMRNVALMYAMRADMGNGNAANPWSATNVTLTASDPAGRSAFNWFGGGYSGNYQGWSDKYFAHSGAAYSTGAFDIRTPIGTPSWTFAGDSLTINAGGRLLYNSYLATGRITINNLVLAGGTVRHDQFPADVFRLVGNGITVTANSTFEAANGNIVVGPAIGGTGGLTFAGGYTTTLSSINTYTGGTTVNAGTLALNAGGNAGAIRGALTVNSGATVRLNAADALGTAAGTSVTQVTVNGGTLDHAVAGTNGYNASFTLNGGTVAASGGGAYQINAAAGRTITSLASATPSTFSGNLVVRGAGGVLPINVADGAAANDLVISGAVRSGTGETSGIGKVGAGTLVLSGANTYTGPTNVNAGTVAFTTSQSNVGPVTVADSATLRVAAVGPTVATLTSTALTVGSGGTSALTFDLASLDTTSPLVSTGAFAASGSVNVAIQNGGALTTGLHPLVGYTSYSGDAAFTGSPFTLGPRSTGTLVNDGTGSLGLDVVADRPIWTGGDNANWTTAATGANKNWKLQTALSATDYLQGDNVLFDDTAAGSTSVSLNGGNVSPAAVTFNNSAKSYSVSGSGGIVGAAAVVKNGTNAVFLGTINSYTGGTTINAGRVIAGVAGALGTGAVRMNGAGLGSTVALTVSGGLAVTGTNTLGYASQNGNITINGGLGGNGTLTNFVGSATSYSVLFNGDLGNFTGTIIHTGNSGAATGWWRVGQTNGGTNLANATVILNKGNITDLTAANKNFGFTDGITNATVNLGALSGDGAFQSSYNGSGPNTLAVGFLNTSTTFSGVIAGGDGGTNMSFVKAGAGTLTLSGANRYTGNTAITGGAISVAANNNLGGDAATLSLNGGTLIATAGFASTHATTVDNGGGNVTVTAGQLYLPNTNQFVGSGPLVLAGPGTLTAGLGNLRLAAANSYSGAITLRQGGILEYGTNGSVATAATVRLESQAELSVQGGGATTFPNAVTVAGATSSVLSFENGDAGVVTGPVNVLAGATLTVGLRDWYNTAIVHSGTINGAITGGGSVAVNSGTAAGGTLTLGGASTFTGNLSVTNATVAAAYGPNSFDTNGRPNSAFGNEQTAGRTVTVNTGGTVSLAVGNVLGSGGSTLAQAPNLAFVVNAGGTLKTSAPATNGAGGGDANILGSVTLNGGTLTTGNGYDANYQALILLKNVVTGGTTPSLINTNATNAVGNGIMLGDAVAGTDTIAFTVADATASSAADLVVNARFTNSANSAAFPANIGALTKAGPGTMTMAGSNTYTGKTTVAAGTLRATTAAYANTVLGTGTGGLDVQGGRFVFDYGTGNSPLATVKSILAAGYAQATKFSTGQIKSTGLAAGRTLGYGDTGGGTVTVAVTLPGDATLDGQVDFDDFVALQSSFGQTGTTFAQGDFDFNNVVDFNDFVQLQSNFGQSLAGRAEFTRAEYAAVMSITNASQVPEPAALTLFGVAATATLRRRRHSR